MSGPYGKKELPEWRHFRRKEKRRANPALLVCFTLAASMSGRGQTTPWSIMESFTNYVTGANIAGFVKVADSMIDQGVV